MQWSKEGQTIQWSKEGQTIQWSKEGQKDIEKLEDIIKEIIRSCISKKNRKQNGKNIKYNSMCNIEIVSYNITKRLFI